MKTVSYRYTVILNPKIMYEIMNKEKSLICGPKHESVQDFFAGFKSNYPDFSKKNVIVDLSNIKKITNSEILLFLNTAKLHFQNNTSFVIVAQNLNIDALPDVLVTTPTMVEALDIIELDEIGRDLGF